MANPTLTALAEHNGVSHEFCGFLAAVDDPQVGANEDIVKLALMFKAHLHLNV